MPTTKTLLIALGLTASVAAHGIVTSVVAGGRTYPGFDVRIWQESSKPTVGWKIPDDTDTGFIAPDQYAAPDIICHKNAAPASVSAVVEAGGSVELQWTTWPESHHGPVITYLANCNGPCETVDKTQLQFNKIEAVGMYSNNTIPYQAGKYASDQLIQNGNKWTVTIPSTIAKGNYVLRHEIIGLHSAFDPNGAQNYPQCINLEVTGSGTDVLASGTLGENLYKADEPGILVSIYKNLTYIIPGPPLYSASTEATPAPAASLTSQSDYVATSSSTTAPDSSFSSYTTTTVTVGSAIVDSTTATADSRSVSPPSQSAALSTAAPISTGLRFVNASVTFTTTTTESIASSTPSATVLATSDTSSTSTQTLPTPIYTPSTSTPSASISPPPSASSDADSVTGASDSVDSSNPPTRSSSLSSLAPPSHPETSTSPPGTSIPLPQNATVQELLDLLWCIVARLRQMDLRASKGAGSTKRRHARDLVRAMAMAMV